MPDQRSTERTAGAEGRPLFAISPKIVAAQQEARELAAKKAANKKPPKVKAEPIVAAGPRDQEPLAGLVADSAPPNAEEQAQPTDKTEKETKWSDLPREAYLEMEERAFHFGGKSVNTNIQNAPAVRLSAADTLNLPFVSVSTLGVDKVDTDYAKNLRVTPFSQVRQVWQGTAVEYYKDLPPTQEQIDFIDALTPEILNIQRHSPLAINIGHIDERLRQIIMPTGDAESPWVSLTPLPSGGLSSAIKHRLQQEFMDGKNQNPPINTYRSKAMVGVGGGKAFNAGRHTTSMRSPLVFTGPTEDADVRRAFAIHFKGHLRTGKFYAPFKQTMAFLLWRQAVMKEHKQQTMPTSLELRKQEADHIHAIANAALRNAEYAHQHLVRHQDCLNGLTSEQMDPFLRALIDPDLRDRAFKRTFSTKLIRSIERFAAEVEDKSTRQTIEKLNDGDLNALVSIAEEVFP